MPPKPTPSTSGTNAAASSSTNNSNAKAPVAASTTAATGAAPVSASAKAAAAIASAISVDAPSTAPSPATGAAAAATTATAAAAAATTAKPAAKKVTKKKATTKKMAASAGSTLKKKKKASSSSASASAAAAAASGSSAGTSATGAVLLSKTTAAGIGAKLGAKAGTTNTTASGAATAKKPIAPKLQKAPKLPKPAPGNSAVANIQFSSTSAKSTSSSPKNSPTKAKAKTKTSSSSPKTKTTSSASSSSKSKSKSGSGGSTTKSSSSSNNKNATSSASAGTTASSSAVTSAGTLPTSAALLAQKADRLKLQRSQIASRELQEMEAMERAFKEDMSVWCRKGGDEEFLSWMKGGVGGSTGSDSGNGRDKTDDSSSLLWPKRYHEEKALLHGEFQREEKNGWGKLSDVANAYLSFYGSQSQGWMYGEGHAGIGGRSWMEATLGVSSGDSVVDNDSAVREGKKGTDASADSTKTNKAGGETATVPPVASSSASSNTKPTATPNATPISADQTASAPTQVSSMQQTPSATTVSNPNISAKDLDSSMGRSDVTSKKHKGFLMDDVTIIENALKANGLSRADVTPKAYACFLEQARRYALELLADAQDYAIHAQRNTLPTLLPEDLHLAAQLRGDLHGIPSSLPTFEELSEFASEVNRVPLPSIPTNCYDGVVLPPVEQQLTARTFDVVNGARVVQRMMRGGDAPSTAFDIGLVKKSNNALLDAVMAGAERSFDGEGSGKTGEKTKGFIPSSSKAGSLPVKGKRASKLGAYGAGRGRQIAVNIKSNKKSGDTGDAPKTGPATLSETKSKLLGDTSSGDNNIGSTLTKSSSKAHKRKLTEL